MRIVCSVGLRDGAALMQRILALTAGTNAALVMVHVIDTGPRQDLMHRSGPLRVAPHDSARHSEAINAAEESAGRATLDEALAEARLTGCAVVARVERGKPERVLVAIASEVQASLVVIRAREHTEGHPFVGPTSVGHVARYVLDHAPCDVLLLRN